MPILLKTRFRFMAMAILAALAVTLAVSLPGVSADGASTKDTGQGQAPPIPEKAELNYPNLGSHLDRLVTKVEEGEATSEDAAGDTAVHSGESVAVTIHLTGNVDAVLSYLEDNGGGPRNVGEDYIEAYVPVALLGQVSEQPGVIRVREIVPPEPEYGPITSQGVQAHGSAVWNQTGYSGQGVKVGIIDSFEGIRDLMGSELPSTVIARCYTDVGRFTQNLADCDADSAHGTGVAEAIMDIAPEVSLYIANPISPADEQETARWMTSQGVSVISRSASFPSYQGPGDGTSPFSWSTFRTIDEAVANGSIWVNSAGNYAQRTWFSNSPTTFTGTRGTRFLAFDGVDDDGNNLRGAGAYVTVHLRWEDSWPGASSDLDLLIWDYTLGRYVASSEDYQTGGAGHIPTELLRYRLVQGREYDITVIHASGSVPDWVQVVVRGTVAGIQHITEHRSINNASESANRGMLAVGASHYWDTHTIADYSSRGPTPDGRIKPDIVGTACGEAASYDLKPPEHYDGNRCWFPGTSQAAPHVAGLAALVSQRFPDHTPEQVANYLKGFAQQRETPDPNNTWGHGFAQLPSPDRAALVALYNATSGPNWTNNTNWLSTEPIGQWHGVTTDANGRVTNLDLNENLLTGTIPSELRSLSSLQTLELGRNQLSGTIPTWLGNLANLQELQLTSNQLTGTIPTELGNLANLQELLLGRNQLSGPIPTELGELVNLSILALGGNGLTGEIPSELGNLSSLRQLYLWDNELTGTIPSGLGSLSQLTWLSLLNNELSGEMPPELGNLSGLENLRLWGNQLSGEIPSELGNLANLTELSLGENQFTGEIPPTLSNLANLEELLLRGNQLTGEIPAGLGSLANLERLTLDDNQLIGEIPSELGNLANLTELSLSINRLTGKIPADLGSLASLEKLRLLGNQLSGEIPSELGSLTNLTDLILDINQLSGDIPPQLGRLANLERLYLSVNRLTGEIPTELGNLSNLEVLSLSDNRLTGALPDSLTGMTALEGFLFLNNPGLCAPVDDAFQEWLDSLAGAIGSSCAPADSPEDKAVLVELHRAAGGAGWWNSANWLSGRPVREWHGVTTDASGRVTNLLLDNNQLTGEIPTELGGLAMLERLWLHDNQLSGEIPAELGNLANLEELYLYDNQLTGTIPAEMGGLTNLAYLRLDGNQLTGPIPAELGRLTNLWQLRLSGNQLTGCVPDRLQEVADNDFVRLGLPFCPPGDPLVARYDANGDGAIDIGELFSAIDDYFAGLLDIGQLFTLIDLYFSGSA